MFYSDSGAHFTASIDPLIDLSRNHNQDIISFEGGYIEKDWTKRDAFIILNFDTPECRDTPQRMGGFMIFIRSKYSLDFTNEILELAQDERLITDLKNQLGFPNYPGFVDHRHDQSLWSLLTKKHGLKAFRDPTQLGNEFLSVINDSPYGQLIDLTHAKQQGRIDRYHDEIIRDGLRPFIRNKFGSILRKW